MADQETSHKVQDKTGPGSGRRKPKPPPPKKGKPEWETAITASLEQNCIAPSDEVILCAFDLYCNALYGPVQECQRQLADLYADIIADVAGLQAIVPGLIERAMAHHPFEFSHIIEQKEPR